MSKARSKEKSRNSGGASHANAPAPAVAASHRSTTIDSITRFAIPMLIVVVFAVMLWWSWMKWADLLVDFGRELYTPWQITQGRVLYRDIAAFYGPLSQYVNAGLFAIFGVSLRTLVLGNVTITLGLLAMLYAVLRAASSRLAATVACLVFVLLFATAVYHPDISNYNYITPYSHEAMHGLVLSMAAMFCLMRFQRAARWWWAAGVGLSLGLVFLTKPESFVAAGPAVVVGMGLTFWSHRATASRIGVLSIIALACAAAPVLAAWMLLSTAMPAQDALRGVLGSWPYLNNRALTDLPFFAQGMGTDLPADNIKMALIVAGKYLLVLVPAVLAGLLVGGRGIVPRFIAALGAAAVPAALLTIGWDDRAWYLVARPLPLFLAIAGVAVFISFVRHPRDEAGQMQRILRLTLIAWAGLLLLKMILLARIEHYGFILAMPGAMLLVLMLVDWIPSCVKKWGGSAMVVQAASLVLLAAIAWKSLYRMHHRLAARHATIGAGADLMHTDSRGVLFGQALDWLKANMKPGQTLLVMPEGVMLNYLLRRETSVPHLTFLPPDLIMFDERRMLDSLRTNPPDYFAIVNRPVFEYGTAAPGNDYANSIMDYILRNYDFSRKVVFGRVPYLMREGDTGPEFGVMIAPRKSAELAPPSPQP